MNVHTDRYGHVDNAFMQSMPYLVEAHPSSPWGHNANSGVVSLVLRRPDAFGAL